MLPSDIQRVTAVDKYHDKYQQYRNVIVCSVKGEQSLASMLAGGGLSSHSVLRMINADDRFRDRLRWGLVPFSR